MKPRRLLFPASLVFSLASLPSSGQTIYDWKSDAPDGNWTQGAAGARWYDNATTNNLWDIPTTGTGAVLRFNNNWQVSMTNNAAETYELHGMIFGSSATSARTIGGNAVRFFDFGGTNPYITNDSSATHVINLALNGDGGEALKININSTGGLTFGGTINNQGSWIDVVGATTSAATGTFNGVISGAGGFYKANANTTAVLAAANTFTGRTTIEGGIVSIAADSGLGAAPGSAVADQLTLNGGTLRITAAGQTLNANRGITLGASGGTIDTSTIAGSGITTTIDGVIAGSGPLTLKSTGNMTAGGGGDSGLGIRLNQATNTFTGDVTITSGLVSYASNASFGNAANKIILNGGGLLDNNANIALSRDIQVLSGGGTFRTYGTTNVTWSGAITGSGTINRTDGGTLTLSGDLSGYSGIYNNQAGTTRFTGANALAGTLTVSGGEVSIENAVANTYTAVNLNGGSLRLKSNNNALGSVTVAVGGNATVASQNGSSALTLANNFNISGTNTLSIDAGYANITLNGSIAGSGTKVRTSSSGTLTLNGTVNMGSTSAGNVGVESNGTMTLGSSAVVTAGNVYNSGTGILDLGAGTVNAGTVSNSSTGTLNLSGATVSTGNLSQSSNGAINLSSGTVTASTVTLTNQTGVLNITGGILNSPYLNIGGGSNASGRISQSGGQVNLSGGTGMRIGHWNNGSNPGSVYNLSGGSLDSTAIGTVYVGWDGEGDMTVGGGAGSALFKANGIYLDGNGNNASQNSTLTISTNGTVQTAANGIGGASTGDNVFLNGGTLRATATGTWSAAMTANASTNSTLASDTGITATASGVISGNGAITKSGAGTVILSGANTFAGGVTVSEGTLETQHATALGSATSISNNGTLVLNVSGSTTWSPTLTGTGNLETASTVTFASGTSINQGGRLVVRGNGTMNIQSGASLSFGGLARLSSYNSGQRTTINVSGGTLTVTGDATDNRDSWFDVTQSGGVVSVARLLSNQTEPPNNGGGTSGNSTYTLTGGQLIAGGISGGSGDPWSRGIVLNLGGGTLTASGNFTMAANTVNLTGTNGDVTIDTGAFSVGSNYGFSGAGGFNKTGSGTLTISQASAYSGATRVSGGVLKVNNTLRNSSSFTARSGATLELGAVNIFVGGHGIALADSRVITVDNATLLMNTAFEARFGNVALKNGATWTSNRTLSGFDALLANTDAGAATVSVVNTGGNTTGSVMNGTGGIHLQGVQNFDVADVTGNPANDLTVSMILASQGSSGGDAGGIKKTGDGTMLLSGANTFTGVVTVNGGIIKVGNATGLGAADTAVTKVVVNSGGTIDFNGTVDATYGYTIAGAGVGGNGALVNNGPAIGNGIKQASNIRLSDHASIGGTGNWALLAAGFGATSLDLAGYTLTKVGGNTVYLCNTTATAGAIRISGGTLSQANRDNSLSSVAITLDNTAGTTLSLGDRAMTIGALAGGGAAGGNVSLGSHTLTVGGLGTDTSYSGAISGTGGSLAKSGAGTLSLDGTNTYTGNTAVGTGRLNVNGSITSATSVAAAAFLGGDGSINGTVNLTGTLLPGQGGSTDRTLTINGNVTTNAGSVISFTIDAMNDHDQLVIGSGGSIGLSNADLDVTFDPLLTFDILGAGEGDDFLAQLDSFAGTGSWFKLISGTTTGMFANVTDTLNASELAYFGLSGTQYKTNIDGQSFWIAQGSTYLVAIPEPRAALLGGIGVLLLLRRRR